MLLNGSSAQKPDTDSALSRHRRPVMRYRHLILMASKYRLRRGYRGYGLALGAARAGYKGFLGLLWNIKSLLTIMQQYDKVILNAKYYFFIMNFPAASCGVSKI